MEEMILKEGKVLPGGVLKVGSFLNQQVDTKFMKEIGDESSDMSPLFETIVDYIPAPEGEPEGPLQMLISTIDYNEYVGRIGIGKIVTNNVVVTKEYLSPDDRILVVDDFLAHGSALTGLIDIVSQAGATLVGCVAAIEKGFQMGGDRLRAQGYRIESLAIIDEMTDDGITFREQ